MKRFIGLLFLLILSGAIVIGWPQFFNGTNAIEADHNNTISLIQQKVLSYSEEENNYYKVYDKGRLIGILQDYDYLEDCIKNEYKNYEADFPDSELGIGEDVYIVPETSFTKFEDIDDKIVDYLINNNLLGVKTNMIEFSTNEGVYSIIYVKDMNDFYEARDRFLLNFIDENSLIKLRNNEKIDSPSDFGSVDVGIQIQETITNKEAIVSRDKIMMNINEIYEYLCYGDNEERVYYTTKEGDTLQGVGYYNNDMTTKQLVMLNPNILSSEKQIITPGMVLNVTYFTSPLTVVVTKEDLSQQLIYPDTPVYIQDDTMKAGETKISIQEESGLKNVLYEEVWINGVLQSGTLKSETVTKQAKQGEIIIGTRGTRYSGTSNLIWPLDNPRVSCAFGCYLNHTGTDFVNKYNHYGNVYAADSGVVYDKGYHHDMGNYVMIDHGNGLKTWYCHLNVPAYVSQGDEVERGQIIGQIGNTGNSEGPHLHFVVIEDGERVNACYYLPCALLEGG